MSFAWISHSVTELCGTQNFPPLWFPPSPITSISSFCKWRNFVFSVFSLSSSLWHLGWMVGRSVCRLLRLVINGPQYWWRNQWVMSFVVDQIISLAQLAKFYGRSKKSSHTRLKKKMNLKLTLVEYTKARVFSIFSWYSKVSLDRNYDTQQNEISRIRH